MAEERRRSRSAATNIFIGTLSCLPPCKWQTVSDLAAHSPCAAAPLQAYYYRLHNPSCVKRASTRWMAVRKEERAMQLGNAWKAALSSCPGVSRVTSSRRWLAPRLHARARKSACRCPISLQVPGPATALLWQLADALDQAHHGPVAVIAGHRQKMWRGNGKARVSCTATLGGATRSSGVQRAAPVNAATR